jgi:dipeptidase
LMNFMRDHLDGTALDMTKDAGAGAFGLPYRWRPLTWKVTDGGDGNEYCNERATATQQTGFSFIAECRSWLPDPIGGILWFGVDDAATSVYTPIYCGINKVPECYKVGNGDLLTYSPTSGFWIFNLVANMCYQRYDMMSADALKVQRELENGYISNTAATDAEAISILAKDEVLSRDFLTDYSLKAAQNTFDRWKTLSEYLLVKYMDGNIKKEKNGQFERNAWGITVMPSQPGYSDTWKKDVIEDTGEKLLVPAVGGH